MSREGSKNSDNYMDRWANNWRYEKAKFDFYGSVDRSSRPAVANASRECRRPISPVPAFTESESFAVTFPDPRHAREAWGIHSLGPEEEPPTKTKRPCGSGARHNNDDFLPDIEVDAVALVRLFLLVVHLLFGLLSRFLADANEQVKALTSVLVDRCRPVAGLPGWVELADPKLVCRKVKRRPRSKYGKMASFASLDVDDESSVPGGGPEIAVKMAPRPSTSVSFEKVFPRLRHSRDSSRATSMYSQTKRSDTDSTAAAGKQVSRQPSVREDNTRQSKELPAAKRSPSTIDVASEKSETSIASNSSFLKSGKVAFIRRSLGRKSNSGILKSSL